MTGLNQLLSRIRACRHCVEMPEGEPLPHDPRPVLRTSETAVICIAGQAPGARVHASGIPFHDPSGERLREWMGVSRDEFYDTNRIAIVPMGFCFPGHDKKGGDLPPRKECARLWHRKVFTKLSNIQLLLTVGQYAQSWHLQATKEKTLTDTVINWRRYLARAQAPAVLPLPHPSWRNNAWLKRNDWFETELIPELQARVRTLLDNSRKAA